MFDWGYSTSEVLRHAIRSLKRSLSIIVREIRAKTSTEGGWQNYFVLTS